MLPLSAALFLFPIAWVGSLGIALVFLFGPLSGSLINRFGCRVTTIAGGVTCALSLTVASFANSITILFLSYSALFGLGASFVFGSSWIVVSKYFQKRRSLGLGVVGSGQGLGVMALGPFLQYLLGTTDWRSTFRVMAGVVFVVCFVALSYAPVRDGNSGPADMSTEDDSCKKEAPTSKKAQGKFSLDFTVCRIPVVVVIAISAGLEHFGRLTPQIHLVSALAFLVFPRNSIFMITSHVTAYYKCLQQASMSSLMSKKRLEKWKRIKYDRLIQAFATVESLQ